MKNFLKLLSLILLTGIIFSACQKEYDIIDGTATGTLKEDASGDCMPVTINGIYTANVTAGAGNYADIQVNIDNIGSYDIKTDTVNGYYFRGTGSVALTGLNTIRLQAGGKPIIAGTDIFKVKFSGTTCELNVSVTAAAPGTTAVFTFGTSGTTCTGVVLNPGTYISGQPATGNTATINVNVTQAGTYAVVTNTSNAVIYSAHGTFTTTGPATITLNAAGTPANSSTPVTSSYLLQGATANCSFDVTYAASLPPATITPTCAGAAPNGTYQAGTVMTSANTITIPVTVGVGGAYTATAASQNGVSFSGAGTVTTATTSITLTASATVPTAAGTFTYPIVLNGTPVCSVPVTFTAGTAAAGTLQGTINGSLITFNVMAHAEIDNSFPPFVILTITGNNNSTSSAAETISFDITSGSAIAPGTYTVNSPSPQTNCDYTDAASHDYQGVYTGTTQADPFTIVITSISATRVIGTFKGTLDAIGSSSTGTKVITGGTFDVPVQ